jgi:hypothetical protein
MPLEPDLRYLPGTRWTPQDRRNDFDVTNTVRVSSVDQVRDAVRDIYDAAFPGASFDLVWLAFHDFAELFAGNVDGYEGCDTVYHDVQHTLDMTLAMARLVAGYEKSSAPQERLGAERATMGLITSLFHDSGYIRESNDKKHRNGAEYTMWHVSRSADYLRQYLPRLGLDDFVPIASQVVHFTGYEVSLDNIELDDPRDSQVGHLLGTADLIAQMADRCYLEKCRDRLFPEFVLAGIAVEDKGDGKRNVRYSSGIDLLRQTPMFYQQSALKRLDGTFNSAYRYAEAFFDGRNPYMEFIARNLEYLGYLIETGEWEYLRRQPPCFTVAPSGIKRTDMLMRQHLARLSLSTI